jgi:sugar phosphate permease
MTIDQKVEPSNEPKPKNFYWHYAWIIVGLTFIVLLVSSGVRNAPSVFIKPLEGDFGWDRGSISLAIAVSLFAFGFGAPLGGSLIDRFGPKRVMVGGLILISAGLAPLIWMDGLWQLHIFWGLVVGIGTGAVNNVLSSTITYRWFVKQRGLIVGMLSAAAAAGQLIFLPLMVWLANVSGWRVMLATLAIVAAVLLLPVFILMRDKPQDKGLHAYGADGSEAQAAAQAAADARKTPLREAIRTRDFWFLAGTFFICGYTTNGLIGTHLLPHAIEHGFSEVATAGAIGLMGVMNIIGTMASGWLSDRFDNRKLLAIYYTFRASSIAVLPYIIDFNWLLLFAIVYGLDWIATVPPTVNITAQRFGRGSLGTIYGWIFCSHMIGAGVAAYAGGVFRDWLGDYHLIFLSAAMWGFVAAGLSLSLSSPKRLKALAQN